MVAAGDGFYRKHNGLTISVKQAKSGSWHAAHFHGALLGLSGARHGLRRRRRLVTPSTNPACEARFCQPVQHVDGRVLFAALPGLQRSTSLLCRFGIGVASEAEDGLPDGSSAPQNRPQKLKNQKNTNQVDSKNAGDAIAAEPFGDPAAR